MEADVPVGAFLSGGIDSSTVVALAQKSTSSKVRTFSIGFAEEGYDESEHARRVAAHLGTEHTELQVTAKDALDCVPLMAAIYDEPFADSSQIPTYLVARLARRAVTVSLSGDGGDELFAGYPRYGRAQSLHRLLGVVPAAPRRGLAALIEGVSPHAWNRVARSVGLDRESQAHRTYGDRLHRVAQMLRSEPHLVYQYLASSMPEVNRLMPRVPAARTLHEDPGSWPATGSGSNLFMWLDMMTYLPDDLLAKVDRAAMAVSLESRVPILDHRVIEFSHRVPMDMKVRDGMSKWLLRQVLYRHVPSELVDRPKMGFSLPVGAWLRGPLRDWAEALLFSRRFEEEWIDPVALRRIWAEHLSGARDWQQAIWNILMLRGWQEQRSLSPATPAALVA
jgi:asparagine synthase (glutamine-hydrolysing)